MQRSLARFPTAAAPLAAIFAGSSSLLLWSRDFELDASDWWLLALLATGAIAVLADRLRIRASRDEQRAIRERYQAFVATSSEAIWRVELRRPLPIDLPPPDQVDWLFEHGYHAECNETFLSIYGFSSKAEVVGRPLEAIFPRTANNERLLLDFVRDGYRADRVISQDLRREGEIIYIQNSAVGIVAEDLLLRVWGTQIDLTEQRRAEEVLERSERLLAGAERIAEIGSWSYDPVSGETQWSDHLCKMCGRDPASFEPDASSVLATIHPADRDRWRRVMRRALRGEEPLEQEIRVVRADGEIRFHDTKAEGVVGDGGRVVLVLGISRDITRRKQAEKARQELELQVQQLQKLEAIGALAGGIAHDFNNILSASIGFTDLALSEVDEELKAHGYLRQIKRANRRARDLVSQILSFSRRVERRPETVVLAEIIGEALGLIRASLPASIEIRQEVRAADARIRGEGSQFHQILLNLCTNSAQAMPEGGRLLVELDRVVLGQPKETATGSLPAGDYFRLSVTDTGHGMDEATQARIFDPFFTTKRPGEGTGLGLSTVHGIVLNHRGGIVVTSRPGRGTRFALYLPCLGALDAAAEGRIALPAGRQETVMLIDDEQPLVTIGQSMLERLGYRVTAFASPVEALEAVRTGAGSFDLVITDYRMPEMSGLRLADRLRQLGSRLPIVVVTGFPDQELDRELGCGKVQEVLLKPFNLAALGDCIARVLREREAVAEA